MILYIIIDKAAEAENCIFAICGSLEEATTKLNKECAHWANAVIENDSPKNVFGISEWDYNIYFPKLFECAKKTYCIKEWNLN